MCGVCWLFPSFHIDDEPTHELIKDPQLLILIHAWYYNFIMVVRISRWSSKIRGSVLNPIISVCLLVVWYRILAKWDIKTPTMMKAKAYIVLYSDCNFHCLELGVSWRNKGVDAYCQKETSRAMIIETMLPNLVDVSDYLFWLLYKQKLCMVRSGTLAPTAQVQI